MVEEKPENTYAGLYVDNVVVNGPELTMDVYGENRDKLVNFGRSAALEYANKVHPEFSQGGVESNGSPIPFDPEDPNNDPYDKPKEGTNWWYRQPMRVTVMPFGR